MKLLHSISKIVSEATTIKKPFAQGMEHKIYFSKNKPNSIYKVGEYDVVDEWYDVFKENPEIFPKVYRLGRIPNERGIYYVELEKLDTQKFENDWNELELSLEELGIVDVDEKESFTDIYSNVGTSSQEMEDIGKKLYNHDKKNYDFFINLLRVIKEAERTIIEVKGKDTFVDAHKYNFGYSSDGKLKCLDL